MTDALPPRPNDGTEIPIVVNAMLNTQQQQVKNLFENVQHCVDHPKDPACDLSVAPSP
jgi:hypothetical protein